MLLWNRIHDFMMKQIYTSHERLEPLKRLEANVISSWLHITVHHTIYLFHTHGEASPNSTHLENCSEQLFSPTLYVQLLPADGLWVGPRLGRRFYGVVVLNTRQSSKSGELLWVALPISLTGSVGLCLQAMQLVNTQV